MAAMQERQQGNTTLPLCWLIAEVDLPPGEVWLKFVLAAVSCSAPLPSLQPPPPKFHPFFSKGSWMLHSCKSNRSGKDKVAVAGRAQRGEGTKHCAQNIWQRKKIQGPTSWQHSDYKRGRAERTL